jgi:Inner membrane component of T3SS, cytoplasmic domain/Inner membrane component of T3SS, periplasmic domain
MSETKSLSRTASSELQLEVVGGLHSGVRLSLADGDYSIGSKSEADIVLRDDGVASQHVIICIDGNDIRAEAIGGTLRVGDEEIDFGHGCRLRLPTVLTIGSASLRLTSDRHSHGAADGIPFLSRLADRPSVTVSLLGVALAGTIVWQGLHATSADKPNLEMAMTSKAGGRPAASLAAAGPEISSDDAARDLKDRLRSAGIETISISAEGAHLTATGRLPESRASEWTSIQRWFDKTYSPRMSLSANVANDPASAKPAVRLQAIWSGERPHIIAENGSRYYEGAILDNGWVLQQIGDDRVTLKKGEEKLVLTYR